MKITKTKLKQIIKEELVQALNEQTLNEQEPYNPRQGLDKPYSDVGADKKYAYTLNGRLNKGMDYNPGFLQKMKTKFGGRDPIVDMAMKRLHNVEYAMFYKDLRGLSDEERAEKQAYRNSKEAFNEFWQEIENLKDTRALRRNQGMRTSKEQSRDYENLIANAEKRRIEMGNRAEGRKNYVEKHQQALELQKNRRYKEANELIDEIDAAVKSGKFEIVLTAKRAMKTDDRGRLLPRS
jgi:hypothetical protein